MRSNRYPKILEGLAAEARKAGTFEEFRIDFLRQIKHGLYWHFTRDPNFRIDLHKGPRDMSTVSMGGIATGALIVTSDFDRWADYDKRRLWVARIDLTAVPRHDYYQVNRGFGNELFVVDSTKASVVGVYDRKTARRIDRRHRAALPNSEEALSDFYEKAVATDGGRSLKRRRNPLDPLAWEHEPYPAGHERQRHLKIGVHTSLSFDIAMLYGVAKAGLQGPLDDDESNCAVVFEIDTTGLPKDYDIDATYAAEYGDSGLRDLVNEENVKAALLDGDVFPALEEITRLTYYSEAREATDSWHIAMWQEVSGEWSEAVLGHLCNIGEDDPDHLHDILLDLLQTGRLDPRVWAEAIQQYRYHEPLGLERIIRITAIRPVEDTLLRDYEDVEEDEGPQQFAEADAWEGYAVPDKVVLWQNPRPGPQQLSFGHVEVQAPEYHGTDLKRARAAFPELRKYLVSPWSYTQPTI